MNDDNQNYTWPDDYPEDIPESCDVKPAEGKVYRLVRTVPPTAIDFQRHRDEKPNYIYRNSDDKAKSWGISLWSKLAKIKRVAKNYPFPEQYGSWHTVCGNLCSELGVIPTEASKDGHVTLWVQAGAEPHNHIKDEVKS
ncbi:hypothetical protein Q6U63_003272 [Vibrio fluvialis]|nr:hypothetical protein [Vibrio fluvialis]